MYQALKPFPSASPSCGYGLNLHNVHKEFWTILPYRAASASSDLLYKMEPKHLLSGLIRSKKKERKTTTKMHKTIVYIIHNKNQH